MKIYLQDFAFAHCEFSNNPLPIKQRTDKVEWVRDDTFTSDDVVVYTDENIYKALDRLGKNIAWLLEPYDLIPKIYNYVIANAEKFEAIWTHDKEIIAKLPNAILLPFGGCWIDDFNWNIYPKSKDFSIIASWKRNLPGHILRHQIIASAEGHIDVFGNGYREIADKIEGLKDYRYTFCIESSTKDYYFSEKLIDCFVTGTLPIYWGCPSIGDFFNIDGMLCFKEIHELPELLKKCTPEYYESKLDAIKENFELAQQYILAELQIPQLML